MSVKILYGESEITANEISSIKIIEEPDVLSTTLRSATVDVVLVTDSLEDIIEHKDDVFTIYYGENFAMKTAFLSYKQKSQNVWSLEFENYIKILEKHNFHGDIYDGKPAHEVIYEIFESAGFSREEIIIDETLIDDSITLTGFIPYTNCKESLMQVLFPIGAIATSENGMPCIVSVSSQNTTNIPNSRTLVGVKVEEQEEAEYEYIELTAYSYSKSHDTKIMFQEEYNMIVATEDNPQRLELIFDEPCFDYNVVGALFAAGSTTFKYNIIEQSANHIVLDWWFSGSGKYNVTITVYADNYKHTTSVFSNDVEDSEDKRSKTIEDMTLVNSENAETIIARCLEEYARTKSAVAKIVIGKHVSEDDVVTYDEDVKCGDIVTIPTDFQGEYNGRIVKEQYNLNNVIIIKEITVK